MQIKISFTFLLIAVVCLGLNAQTDEYYEFVCGTTDEMLQLPTRVAGGYSANGCPFTPKGDLRALVICAGFGPEHDSQYVNGWDSALDSIPQVLKNGSLFYSDYSQFTNNPPASAIDNVSAYYYAMSSGQFRLAVDVYPKRINIAPGGSYSGSAKKVIEQMKIEDPNFDWSKYDKRTNLPNFTSDNRNTPPDMKPDYVIIIYRYARSFALSPFDSNIPGDAYANINLGPNDNYNGYTFHHKCGYTQLTGGGGRFSSIFIHEVAHTLYNAPHVSAINHVMGNYYYLEKGWSQMAKEYAPFVSSNAWERWYLDWIDGIKASGVNADIKSASDLNASGEYVLRDFITKGDAVRIKIPNGTERNQYLWLENHQGNSIYDNKLLNSDQCNTFPASPRGIVAYLESINDDKNSTEDLLYSGKNGLKFIHAAGNFDYTYQGPPSSSCWYGNDVYDFQVVASNPIAGQCGAQDIKSDFNNNNQIDLDYDYNSVSTLSKEDNKNFLKRDGVFHYDFMNGERAFAAGRKFSMASNPCLINRPTYNSVSDKMAPYYLNGISVSVLSYDSNGNARIKIQYKDVGITNDTRYAGTIHLQDITGDVNPDINIMSNVTLRIDKSGTPNKRIKTVAGDFVNLTEFRCLANSYFKQSANSKVHVENGSSLIIESGAKYEVVNQAELGIKSGSSLIVKAGGALILGSSAHFFVEQGAILTVEPGAIIN